MENITISIITVVYNGKDILAGTIESVLHQTWPHIEYLIIDGGSTDGTLDIIQSYAQKMPHLRWISEPDNGLYDAMNKGLRMATGEFVQFLNGGDWLHAPDTIASLMEQVTSATGVLYGETMLVDDQRRPAGLMSALSTRKLPDSIHWTQYLNGMLVVHQSFIPRRSLAPEYIAGNLCADFDWCIKILKNSAFNINTQVIITDYLMGGMSKKRHRQSLKDRFAIMRVHYGLFPTLLAHIWFVIRAVQHKIVRWGREKY
jgi:glycosyltransferase involved in cell wall biosynthesis